MVVPLQNGSIRDILEGKPQTSDPANLESYIRSVHHELVEEYITQHFDFLSSLGVSPPDCGLIKDIARCHRKTALLKQTGCVKYLGAVLRVIDELDIGPERAPAANLINNFREMDGTSLWHWFKHNITETWRIGHNVKFVKENDKNFVHFDLIVRPPRSNSISYWLHQSYRPIYKTLVDDGTNIVLADHWNVSVRVTPSSELSSENPLGLLWEEIEQKSLSEGRKVVLLVDDEVRKMEDLFIPLMDDFHVIFSPSAKDALTKIQATNIDLAIIDLQVGSGSIWTSEETEGFKLTGKRLCDEIIKISPQTKLAVLTGTRYDLKSLEYLPLVFLFKKPVNPETFEE
jgi:hypothetical protein